MKKSKKPKAAKIKKSKLKVWAIVWPAGTTKEYAKELGRQPKDFDVVYDSPMLVFEDKDDAEIHQAKYGLESFKIVEATLEIKR